MAWAAARIGCEVRLSSPVAGRPVRPSRMWSPRSYRPEVATAPDAALVRIADAGPGIPAADRDRVFDRFHRVDKARSRDRGGSGPGLSVARGLVEAHGGSLALDRENGLTVFTVGLPLRPAR
ncbi:histidine kinase/DNA gyrase B/HSP90-like ATPase [Streptomyces sp. BK340]|nr:histidine kinase/DNA gyrase B/HSP90-like ATPase [Streptomyces sp. BK340]